MEGKDQHLNEEFILPNENRQFIATQEMVNFAN